MNHESKTLLIISTIMVFYRETLKIRYYFYPGRERNIYKTSDLKGWSVLSMKISMSIKSKENLIKNWPFQKFTSSC